MDAQASAIWNQQRIPVALRRTGRGEKIRVRLPYGADNRAWLQHGHKSQAKYLREGHYWELPKA